MKGLRIDNGGKYVDGVIFKHFVSKRALQDNFLFHRHLNKVVW